MRFDLVDLVSEGLHEIEGVVDTLSCAAQRGGHGLLLVRHLMFHLTVEENLKVLENIEGLMRAGGVKYVVLSTYLRQNDNEKDYLLATGHKINLFRWPYCLTDPIHLVKDGDDDLYVGLWNLEGGATSLLRRSKDEAECISTKTPSS